MNITVKNSVFRYVTPYGTSKNNHFRVAYYPIIRVKRIGELGTLAVTSN
jgi:hypothetical protein